MKLAMAQQYQTESGEKKVPKLCFIVHIWLFSPCFFTYKLFEWKGTDLRIFLVVLAFQVSKASGAMEPCLRGAPLALRRVHRPREALLRSQRHLPGGLGARPGDDPKKGKEQGPQKRDL